MRNTNRISKYAERILIVLVVLCMAIWILLPAVIHLYYVPSPSMEPTLIGHNAGEYSPDGIYHHTRHDHFLVNMLIYHFESPKRGDVILFRAPKSADLVDRNPQQQIEAKRVIGTPGDTIQIRPDDKGVTRVFLNGEPLREPYLLEPMIPSIPGAKYGVNKPFKLGPRELFVMGDNRNMSYDSRFWGPLPLNSVMGKAIFIYSPPDRMGWIH